MNIERFKIEMTRGVQALLPWAMEHKKYRNLPVSQVMTPESQYEFLPFHMIFTVECVEGVSYPMVSLSAALRPIKILSRPEQEAAKEVMGEMWPGFTVMGVKNFMRNSSAFKVVALPVDCPSPLMDFYKKLAI
jgi:hypothetical protein